MRSLTPAIMKRVLAALAVMTPGMLVMQGAAHAQNVRPLVERAVAACFAFRNETATEMSAPQGFAPNPRGFFSAVSADVLVGVVAGRAVDPDLDTSRGECQVRVEGEVDWFAYYAQDLSKNLLSNGWDKVEHETIAGNGVMQYAFTGFGSIKFAYGVGKPNAYFQINWID
jgi:hypothetical protein